MRVNVVVLFLFLVACSANESPTAPLGPATEADSPEHQTYKGYYVWGFERSEFRPINDLEQRWWLSGAIENCPFLNFNQERYSPWHQTYLEVQGVLSPPGQYGHLAFYKRELTIVKAISCRPPRDDAGVEP